MFVNGGAISHKPVEEIDVTETKTLVSRDQAERTVKVVAETFPQHNPNPVIKLDNLGDQRKGRDGWKWQDYDQDSQQSY